MIYAYQFGRLGARVEVFEPFPICSSFVKARPVSKSAVNFLTVALSSHPDSVNLHIPIDAFEIEPYASTSIENTVFALAHYEVVALQTLDSFHSENINLIKIDIKGVDQTIAS